MKVEEQYQDVLQNIEFEIVEFYRKTPDLTDYNVICALQGAIEFYKAELRQQTPKPAALNAREQTLYARIRPMCEWRLGRLELKPAKPSSEEVLEPIPISIEEILLCLKRVLKSVEFWNRNGGRQGYLNYVSRFIP